MIGRLIGVLWMICGLILGAIITANIIGSISENVDIEEGFKVKNTFYKDIVSIIEHQKSIAQMITHFYHPKHNISHLDVFI